MGVIVFDFGSHAETVVRMLPVAVPEPTLTRDVVDVAVSYLNITVADKPKHPSTAIGLGLVAEPAGAGPSPTRRPTRSLDEGFTCISSNARSNSPAQKTQVLQKHTRDIEIAEPTSSAHSVK